MTTPSTNAGDIGRTSSGQFAKGNSGGPGNPHVHRVAGLRKALYDRLSVQDVCDVIDGLVKSAKEGDVAAAKLVLAYAVGDPRSLEESPGGITTVMLAYNPLGQRGGVTG